MTKSKLRKLANRSISNASLNRRTKSNGHSHVDFLLRNEYPNLSLTDQARIATYIDMVDVMNDLERQFNELYNGDFGKKVRKLVEITQSYDMTSSEIGAANTIFSGLEEIKEVFDKFFSQGSEELERKWKLPDMALAY